MSITPKLILPALLGLLPLGIRASEVEITNDFNSGKPILPSSQYTPDQPYTASVWVFNTGERYNSDHYNHIWATPANDTSGRQWFEPEYEETSSEGIDWIDATAPFSSDEYYKDHLSYRWVTAEIMGEIYLRRSFTLNELPAGNIYLACGHDDAPSEWYINGVMVHSVSDGWNNDEYILLTDEQKALLKADGSENILAVHVHQNWGGAYADCGLYESDMHMKTTLLPTVGEGGAWPCNYYLLNYNTDMDQAVAANWAANEEDEADWINGFGPFSIDDNMFFTTMWPSTLRPLLVRRHFNLSAEALAAAKAEGSRLTVTCSYDENPAIFLNGQQIWSATGWNDNNYASIVLTDEQRALLREGDNVLCVSLLAGNGGGHVDYGMSVVTPYDSSSGISLPAEDSDKTVAADNRIFNLYGQFMGTDTSRLKSGIYIVGGKKIAVNN